MILKYNKTYVDEFSVEDWKDLHQTMIDFSDRVVLRNRARLSKKLQVLCEEIEKLPASQQQTQVSVLASDIRKMSDPKEATDD